MNSIDYSKYPQNTRIRHHISSNVYFPFNENIKEPDRYPPLISDINWNQVFENGTPPDMLDIGCGFGKFLLNSSLQFPDMNLLGIEVRPVPVDWIKSVIAAENLKNVHIINYSVANGLTFINDNSVSFISYFFPDPWFKTRHLKRRAFNLKFLDEIHRVLKSESKFFIQTDVEEVHKYHLDILSESGKCKFTNIDSLEKWSINGVQLTETDHEIYVNKKGMDKFRIIAEKLL